jgi:hemerythrin-like domain-containing protein
MLEHMGKDVEKSSLHQQIDENLKRVYKETLEEDVPDRFRALLEELRKKQSEGKAS